MVAFVPLTLFYFFVVLFNINVTSSRLHGVVWYGGREVQLHSAFAVGTFLPSALSVFCVLRSLVGTLLPSGCVVCSAFAGWYSSAFCVLRSPVGTPLPQSLRSVFCVRRLAHLCLLPPAFCVLCSAFAGVGTPLLSAFCVLCSAFCVRRLAHFCLLRSVFCFRRLARLCLLRSMFCVLRSPVGTLLPSAFCVLRSPVGKPLPSAFCVLRSPVGMLVPLNRRTQNTERRRQNSMDNCH